MYAIIVHGGAGSLPEKEDISFIKDGIKKAVQKGFQVLEEGFSSLDAVERAVCELEDNPYFNAGTGAVLTIDGKVELDASIMYGPQLQAGAVAGIENVKNPISLARLVMTHTDHVLLAGKGAMKFAKLMSIPEYNPITDKMKNKWQNFFNKLKSGKDLKLKDWPKLREFIKKHPDLLKGTVGAVAIDKYGNLAAATSTGGVFFKLLGRVGDTPLIGSGTYAEYFAAASATGIGEGIIRTNLAKTVTTFIRLGLDAQSAANAGINYLKNTVNLEAGIITIDKNANIGVSYYAPFMSYGYKRKGEQLVLFNET